MNAQLGFIARFAREAPMFFDASHDVGRLVVDMAKHAATRQPLSVDRGLRVMHQPIGVPDWEKRLTRASLFTGNAVTPLQHSWYIRAKSATVSNGHTFAPGELRAADLKCFGRYQSIFERWLSISNHRFADTETIGYMLRDQLKSGRVIERGWLITDTIGNLLASCTFGRGWRERNPNQRVMDEAIRVMTHRHLVTQSNLVQWESPLAAPKVLDSSLAHELAQHLFTSPTFMH